MIKRVLFPLLCAIIIGGCSDKTLVSSGNEALLLSINEKDGYEEIVIRNPKGKETARYALADKNRTDKLDLPEGISVINVPVDRIVLDSEVYGGALEELGTSDKIKGMFDAGYATSQSLKNRIERGEIENLGPPGSPNNELIVSLEPDVIILSYFEGMNAQGLEDLGPTVIKMLDLQEPTPTGRAEWIRLLGRLTGKAEESDSIFNEVKNHYTDISATPKKTDRPRVLTELMYEGVWNTAASNSYHATLIRDAGGEYFTDEESASGTLNLTPEQALYKGGDSDIWLIRYYGSEEDLRKILASDPVYREFEAYKKGNIYFSDTSTSGLFRDFPFHPELLLEDYKKIFSGETTGLRYFKRLGE